MMNRRKFISNSCIACAGGVGLSYLLQSCAAHYVTGTPEPDGISIMTSAFVSVKKGERAVRDFIVVQHDDLEFSIYLYRISNNEYSALWMKCTHQGSELNAGGDHLYCSSHGSEFDKNGNVIHGPAARSLRSFSTYVHGDKIIIQLKKG